MYCCQLKAHHLQKQVIEMDKQTILYKMYELMAFDLLLLLGHLKILALEM